MLPQLLIAIAGAVVGFFTDPDPAAVSALVASADSVDRAEAPAERTPAEARDAASRAEAPETAPAPRGRESASGGADDATGTKVAQAVRVGPAGGEGDASEEVTAAEVVEGVQSFYEDTEHLTAVFRQVYTNQTFGEDMTTEGRVWLKKNGKMRWDYQSRETGELHKSFISNGSELWAIEHDTKQAFRKSLGDTVLPVAVTFLTGEGELSRDFDPSLEDSDDYGGPGDYVLKLVPKRPSARYKTLWLVVDPDNFRVKQSIVVEASGNTNHFRFFEPNTERPVQDSWFEVDEDALEGYRIIEPE